MPGTLLAVLLWLAAATWVGRIIVALVLDRGRWSLGPRDAPSPGPDPPLVSILIPARDEELTIGACLASVLAQDYPRLEVVVADDQSRDRTAEVARRAAGEDPRVTILSVAPPEPGWMGKSAALWTARKRARGEWLLFLDADVVIHPRAVSAAVGAARRDGADMQSWLGGLETGSFWERVVLPVMSDLILRWAPVWRVNRGVGPPLANGQFLFLRAGLYDAVGGHRAVRGDVTEDVALCRLVRTRRRDSAAGDAPRYRLYRAPRLMTVRMYRSLRSVWLGFAKNSFHALGSSVPRVAGAMMLVGWLDILPWVVVLSGPFADAAWRPAALAVGATILHRAAGSRSWPRPAVLLHPLGALVCIGILADSALRGAGWRAPAPWKGRPSTAFERRAGRE